MRKKQITFRDRYENNVKSLKKKYKRLRTKYFLLFTLPIFLITVCFQAAKEFLKIKARNQKK